MLTRYLTLLAAVGGTADTAEFLLGRRHLFRENIGRASGTAAGLGLWSALALSAAIDRSTGRRTLGLAASVALANASLLAIHLRSRLVTPRVFLGPALAAVALSAAAAGSRA